MSLNWKAHYRRARLEIRGLKKRVALWEGLAKERTNAKNQQELDIARMDAFTGWVSARILRGALEEALSLGRFSLADRAKIQKELGKVRFEDPEQFKC